MYLGSIRYFDMLQTHVTGTCRGNMKQNGLVIMLMGHFTIDIVNLITMQSYNSKDGLIVIIYFHL